MCAVCDEDDISTVLLVSLETEISILGALLTTDLVTVLRGDLLFECFLGEESLLEEESLLVEESLLTEESLFAEESLGDLVVLIETGHGDLDLRVVVSVALVESETRRGVFELRLVVSVVFGDSEMGRGDLDLTRSDRTFPFCSFRSSR